MPTLTTTIFSPERLQQVIDETIPADAKPGEHFVIGTLDQSGAQVVAVFQVNQAVRLEAAARHNWNGENQVGAKVIARW